jgi:hypothetical protein
MALALGLEFFQAHFLGDIIEFLAREIIELFAAGLEPLIDLNDFFGHGLMGRFRAADEGKIFARGDPFMPIGIQANTEHHCPGLFLRFRH